MLLAAYSASVLKWVILTEEEDGWRPRSWRFAEAERLRSVAIVERVWGWGGERGGGERGGGCFVEGGGGEGVVVE